MTNGFKQLALIGSTASGKTALAIRIAHQLNAVILSLDSLALYREIDIASAKPTLMEREGITHYGIDILNPDERFDVTLYAQLYQEVSQEAIALNKNLIIVGGTGFYLKALIDGMSQFPLITQETHCQTQYALEELQKSYQMLYTLDPNYMAMIAPTDRYRIEKMLDLYFQTQMTPSHYFAKNPPQPIITQKLPLYEIEIPRDILKKRILLRTHKMIEEGLIDEVCKLEKRYTRTPNSMKSIGIKETLAYLDGVYNKEALREQISTHTAQLAKRQNTFNASQFENVTKGSVELLYEVILKKQMK